MLATELWPAGEQLLSRRRVLVEQGPAASQKDEKSKKRSAHVSLHISTIFVGRNQARNGGLGLRQARVRVSSSTVDYDGVGRAAL